jgi:hypothetical protein
MLLKGGILFSEEPPGDWIDPRSRLYSLGFCVSDPLLCVFLSLAFAGKY